jgi:3-hydroxyacyl-CoA dehydrogenase
MPVPAKVFEIVSAATVSKSATDAKALLFLRADDGITMNRYHLLGDAKARALTLAQQYTPPTVPKFKLPGRTGKLAFLLAVEEHHRRGVATDHDTVVLEGLAEVLSGDLTDPMDVVTEEQLLTLERNIFLRLMTSDGTLARIEHLLTFNKALRN